jgi:hypothetical protein
VLYGPGPWLLVHGPRQDGPGTPGQVSCSEMLGVLSLDGDTKWPCPSQIALFDTSGGPTYRLRTKAIFEIELQLVEHLHRNGV